MEARKSRKHQKKSSHSKYLEKTLELEGICQTMWSRLGLSSPVRCKGYKETTTDQGHAKQVLLPKVNYKIKRERYRKEITTNLLIKSKVDRVQKAARPATQRSQLSPEHFP